jgi:hypothetical protein
MDAERAGVRKGPGRPLAWAASSGFHLFLLVLFLALRLPVPASPGLLATLELWEVPAAQPPEPAASEPTAASPEAPASPAEPARAPEVALPEVSPPDAGSASRLGIHRVPLWPSGPLPRRAVPLDLESRMRYLATPLRRMLASNRFEPARPSAVDTLLFIQQRLEELARDVMAAAREAPKVKSWAEPIPRPGSIEQLRGEPQLPVLSVAAAVVQLLIEEGRKAWNRLIGYDPAVPPPPEMDLSWDEVLAYAALDDYRGLSVFEWHSRMPRDWGGSLGDLQRIAAGLSEKRIITLRVEEQVFHYVRLVPRYEMIAYYTSFLNRLPPAASNRREELSRILAALVREPD